MILISIIAINVLNNMLTFFLILNFLNFRPIDRIGFSKLSTQIKKTMFEQNMFKVFFLR